VSWARKNIVWCAVELSDRGAGLGCALGSKLQLWVDAGAEVSTVSSINWNANRTTFDIVLWSDKQTISPYCRICVT
jgi:hypothetical protein